MPSSARPHRHIASRACSRGGSAATVIADYETRLGFAPEEEHLDAIRETLERAGVEFTDGERPWVRLRK